MNKKLVPDMFYEDIYSVDYELLKEKQIKGLFFDIDNTLESFGKSVPSETNAEFIKKLKEMGFKVGLISNARGCRSREYAETAGMFYVGRAHKPRIGGYKKLAYTMELKPREIAMIGDQIFTDIKGGNKFGALTVIVRPIDLTTEPWYTAWKRFPEKILLKRMKNGKN